MPQCYLGERIKQIYLGEDIKRVYIGRDLVFSRSQTVTYYIDTNVSFTKEVDYGEHCFNKDNFSIDGVIPEKENCEFIGWVENINNVPNADTYINIDDVKNDYVLQEKLMGEESVKLYAIFTKPVTATFKRYYNTKPENSITKYLYYNNGKISAPSFTAPNTVDSGAGITYNGWTWIGWSASDNTAGNADKAFDNGSPILGSSNTSKLYNNAIFYGLYKQGINQIFTGAKNTSESSKTVYRLMNAYNTDNIINPSITFPAAIDYSNTNWVFRGWSVANDEAGNANIQNKSSITVSSNNVFYALYYKIATISYNSNGGTGTTNSRTKTINWSSSGNYANNNITLSSCGFTRSDYKFINWRMGSVNGTAYTVGSSATITDDTIFYAYWIAKTITKSLFVNHWSGGEDDEEEATVDLTYYTKYDIMYDSDVNSSNYLEGTAYFYLDGAQVAKMSTNLTSKNTIHSDNIPVAARRPGVKIKMRVSGGALHNSECWFIFY